jgi:hypothetical protein
MYIMFFFLRGRRSRGWQHGACVGKAGLVRVKCPTLV